MTTITILTLSWIVFALSDGFIQAHYYDMSPATRGHRNLHIYYVIARAIISIHMAYEVAMISFVMNGILYFISLAMIFSFFHNGAYYYTRHLLNKNIYPKGFWDNSTTSTSFIELNIKWRTSYLILGLIFIYGVILQTIE